MNILIAVHNWLRFMRVYSQFINLFCLMIPSGMLAGEIDSLASLATQSKSPIIQINALNELSKVLLTKNNKVQAYEIAKNAFYLSRQNNYASGQSDAQRRLGNVFLAKDNLDSALYYYQLALDLAEKKQLQKQMADALHNLSSVYVKKNNFVKAHDLMNQSYEIRKKSHDVDGQIMSLEAYQNFYKTTKDNKNYVQSSKDEFVFLLENKKAETILLQGTRIGNNLLESCYYADALEIFYQLMEIADHENLLIWKGSVRTHLANAFFRSNDHLNALKYYHEALETFKRIKNKMGQANCLFSIANVYASDHKNDEALVYYGKSEKIFSDIKLLDGIAACKLSSGLIYADNDERTKAEHEFSSILSNASKINDKRIVVNALLGLSDVFMKNKKMNESRRIVMQAFSMANSMNYKEALKLSYLLISKNDSATNNYKSAYDMFKMHIKLKDEIEQDANLRKSIETQLKYEQEKQRLIEKAQSDKIEQQQKSRFNILFILTIFMVGLALIIFISYRRKVKDNKIILQKKEEVEVQRNLLEQKNTEILDSIEYAKRIQSAILPPPRIVKEFLRSSFILYLPKDIVAGDFYWMESIDNTIYFAACDCTGHGVPGAMVSVVCNNALNRSLNEFAEREPGKIFDRSRELVLENFSKSDEEVKDGMDASLCALDLDAKKLQWAGANNPLWIYRAASGTMEEFKADKQPIGKGYDEKPFTTQHISLQKGDIIYLFTDGYADQFGGEKGKKLSRAKFRELLLNNAQLPMEEQREKLLSFHDTYRGKNEQVDDICVMGVKI